MAKAFIDDTNLTDIANAIRATLDESRQYLPSEMAAAIQSVPIIAQLNRKKYFQAVPAGAASGYATIEQIEGNTVAWNQLVDTGSTSVIVQSGHVYYAIINGTASIATSDGNPISVTGGTDIIHDLTLIFGAGNEPTTVADFEAWLAQNGLPSVAAYNAGELLSVKMSGMQTNTSKLPLGYQELEYLQSSGTQYVDTNINITSNFKVVLDIKIPFAIDSTKVILQGKNSITSFKIAGYSNTTLSSTIDNNPSGGGISYTPAQRGIIGLSTHAKKGMSDDVWIELERPFSGTDTLLLFGTAIFNLYNAKLYNGSVLLANFVPAKRLSDNVLGMYDTVSNTFFTNSGTGTFIGGPEVHLDTLPFDVTTITGINTATNVREVIFADGMKQADYAGTVKDELDLLSDTATVKCGSVDMGTLQNWGVYKTDVYRTTDTEGLKKIGLYNLTCSKYITAPDGKTPDNMGNGYISGHTQVGNVYIHAEGYTSITALKASLNGVLLYYELATPITYTDLQDQYGNPLNPRYKVEQGGTEQVLPVNTSTPTTVAPTLTTTYTKDNN